MPLLVGCSGFFVPETGTGGGGTGGGLTRELRVYREYVDEFDSRIYGGDGDVDGGVWSALAASGYVPFCLMVVTFRIIIFYMWAGLPVIYLYLINSNGSLSVPECRSDSDGGAFALCWRCRQTGSGSLRAGTGIFMQVLDIYQIKQQSPGRFR